MIVYERGGAPEFIAREVPSVSVTPLQTNFADKLRMIRKVSILFTSISPSGRSVGKSTGRALPHALTGRTRLRNLFVTNRTDAFIAHFV